MGGLHLHAARAYQLAGQGSQACLHYREADRFYGRPKSPAPAYLAELFRLAAEGRASCRIP